MENETAAKLENAAEFREAIGTLATEIVRLQDMQKAQGELVRAMDTRITLLTSLIDRDREILERAGLAKPRPKEEADVVN